MQILEAEMFLILFGWLVLEQKVEGLDLLEGTETAMKGHKLDWLQENYIQQHTVIALKWFFMRLNLKQNLLRLRK